MAPGGQVAVLGSSADPSPSLLLYTDMSLLGWGAHLLDLKASRVWSEEESMEHIMC